MHNSSSTGSTYWGGGWGNTNASKYGKFDCSTCHSAGITGGNAKQIKSSISFPNNATMPNGGTSSSVILNSYSTYGSDTTHATSVRVCEVCHSQMLYHNYNNSGTNHWDTRQMDCMSNPANCHSHSSGFKKVGCTPCHGFPPTSTYIDTTRKGVGNGLSYPQTNALGASPATAGAHGRHSLSAPSGENMPCEVCHNGYDELTMGNNKIEMGFNVSQATWSRFYGVQPVTWGSYSAYSQLVNSYSWSATPTGTPTAIIGQTATVGYATCSVYCHGGWVNSGGKRVSWTQGSSAITCGNCHSATNANPPATANHVTHASSASGYNISCTTCHVSHQAGDGHTNGSVQWRFSTSIPRVGAGATYARTSPVAVSGSSGSTSVLANSGNFGTCSNIYCHSDASDAGPNYKTVNWGGSALGCTGCHGNDASSGTVMTTGAHGSHINNTNFLGLGQNFGCIECHSLTVSNNTIISSKTMHVNKFKDISGSKSGGRGSYNETTNVCSAAYCHSSGKRGIAGVSEPASPSWYTSTLGCNGCHGTTNTNTGAPDYTSAGANQPASNSHTKHVAGAQLTDTRGCIRCHRRTVDSSTANKLKDYSSLHLTGRVNIAFAPFGNRTGSYNANKTCNNTYCHGAAPSPAWGGPALACNSCHSANNSGAWATSSAHRLHVADTSAVPNNFSNISGNVSSATVYRFTCSACHNPISATSQKSTHAGGPVSTNQSAQVYFGYTTVGVRPTYVAGGTSAGTDNGYNWTSSASSACNSTYCHSSGGTAGQAVTWATTTTTSGNNCKVCHRSTRASLSPMNTGKHKAHMNNYTTLGASMFGCIACHGKTVSNDTTISNKAMHLNKLKNYSGLFAGRTYNSTTKQCSNVYCHSNGAMATNNFVYVSMTGSKAWTGSHQMGCDGCHGRGTTIGYPNYGTNNSHATHATKMNLTSTTGCFKCHRDTVDSANANRLHPLSSNHLDGHADKDVRIQPLGGVTTGSFDSATNTCSNTYCHGSTNTSPAWGTSITCGQYCHNSSTNQSTGLQGTHYKHYTTTGSLPVYTNAAGNSGTASYYKFECKSCHAGTHAGGPDGRANNNGWAEVTFNFYTTKGVAASSYYTYGGSANTDTRGYKWTNGTCSSTYCHTNGNGGAGNVAVQWGVTTLSANCTGCHGGARGTASPMNTGKHARHMNNWTTLGASMLGCKSCHAGTVSADTTVSNKLRHVNKMKNFSGLWANDNYNPTTKTCTTFYCHSDGKGTWFNPGVWTSTNGPFACDGCHGRNTGTGRTMYGGQVLGYPNYTTRGVNQARSNSHAKHVAANNITSTAGCAQCHRRTIDKNNPGRLHPYSSHHLDGSSAIDVMPDTGAGISYTYNTSTKQCSDISCHGGTGTSASWGSTTGLKCKSCHYGSTQVLSYTKGDGSTAKIDTAAWKFSGHGKESGNYSVTNSTFAGFSTAAGAGDMCLYCHDGTVSHSTTPYAQANTNPMRLRNFSSQVGATYGKVTVCLACHKTGSAGVLPGTGYTRKNANKKIDKTHNADKHTTVYNGGKLCWDCHNPHGEATAAANIANPMASIRKQPVMRTYSSGVPRVIYTGSAVVFSNRTANAGNSDWARTSTYNYICNVCHESAAGMKHYLTNSSDGHMSGRDCSACHLHSKDSTFEGKAYWQGGDCVGCHQSTQPISVGGLAGGTRRAVSTEFSGTYGHKKTSQGAVTKWDCIVCHMEGDMGGTNAGNRNDTYHANGVIDLRDPDTGLPIKEVKWDGATPGSYVPVTYNNMTFSRFSRNLGSAQIERQVAAIQISFCLKCHDGDGAKSTDARVPTNGTQGRPFGNVVSTTSTYWNYSVAALNASGNVMNVSYSFNATNAAYHPIKGRQNNSFINNSRLQAPWNTLGTTQLMGGYATTNKTTGNNTSYGFLISCWDCHAPSGTTSATVITNSYVSHGTSSYTRGTYGTGAQTLCTMCHTSTYAGSGNHGAGSAFGTGGDSTRYTIANCGTCHGSYNTGRPWTGVDAHGFNRWAELRSGDTTTPANSLKSGPTTATGHRPFAFLRSATMSSFNPKTVLNEGWVPAGNSTPGCNTSTTTCSRTTHGTISPGGTY